MIHFEFENTEYGIQFRHSEVLAAALDIPAVTAEETRRVTFMDLVEVKTMVPVAQGVAICHPVDQFIKEEGRRGAITDAIRDLPKPLRKAVWDAYFER